MWTQWSAKHQNLIWGWGFGSFSLELHTQEVSYKWIQELARTGVIVHRCLTAIRVHLLLRPQCPLTALQQFSLPGASLLPLFFLSASGNCTKWLMPFHSLMHRTQGFWGLLHYPLILAYPHYWISSANLISQQFIWITWWKWERRKFLKCCIQNRELHFFPPLLLTVMGAGGAGDGSRSQSEVRYKNTMRFSGGLLSSSK